MNPESRGGGEHQKPKIKKRWTKVANALLADQPTSVLKPKKEEGECHITKFQSRLILDSVSYCLERVIYKNTVLQSYYQLAITSDGLDEFGFSHSIIYLWKPNIELLVGDERSRHHKDNFKEIKRIRREVRNDDIENLEWYLARIINEKT